MWNLLSLGAVLAAACPLFLLPGLLTARLITREMSDSGPADDEAMPPAARLLVALAWGFGMVPTFTFFLHLFTGWLVSIWTLALVSTIHSCVAAYALLRRGLKGGIGYRWPSLRSLFCLDRRSGPVLAAAGIGLLYLLKFDNTGPAEWSCLHETAFYAIGFHTGPDLLRENVGHARLGNTGVVAGFLALFGGLGLRLLYALCGVLLALEGFVVGWAIGRNPVWGMIGLVFLPLNPYVAFIPRLDENLLTLAFSGAVIPFVVTPRSRWEFVGALFGLVVTMRHVMIASSLAFLPVLKASPRPWRAVAAFLAAFVVITFPENLHHYLSLGSVFRFEHNLQFPPLPHEFLGVPFEWRGQMNWPFLDHVTRTPHNPFPNFAMWPLLVADHLGLVIWAILILGFFSIPKRSWRLALFFAAWSLPVLAGLAVQECWDYANKSAVIVVVFGALTAWFVAGGSFVLARPFLGGALVVVISIVTHLGVISVRDWRVPADERYYYANPKATEEDPARVEREARRMTDIALLPDFERLSAYGPFWSPRKITELVEDLADYRAIVRYPWGWYPRETPVPGSPVVLRLDLTRRPEDVPDPVTRSGEPPIFDLVAMAGVHEVRGIQVPWDHRTYTLLMKAGSRNTAILLSPDDPTRERVPPGCAACTVEGVRMDLLHALLGEEIVWDVVRVVEHPDPVLDIRLPSGAVSLALFWNLGGARGYLWKVLATEEAVLVAPPFQLWHN